LLAIFAGSEALAVQTIPYKINFQGRLAGSNDLAMPDGTYNMKFRIYNASSALQWSEDRLISAGNGVTVTNGLFSVQLGDVNALSPSLFTTHDLFFEVELPNPATANTSSPSWTEGAMTPRNKLGASAYSFNSDTIDGIDSASLAQLGTANAFTNSQTVNVTSSSAVSITSGGSSLFTADTSSSRIVIGQADTTGSVLVLDTKSSAGDPTGASAIAGAMYYNSSTGRFRCYQNTGWTDCIGGAGGGGTLQQAYDSSASPATIVTTAAKGVKIQAGAAPTSSLLTVDNTGQAVTADNVNGIDVKYAGGAGDIEGAGMRVDFVPGTTALSEWSGLRIVADATGPASGVSAYGIKIEGPTTPGAGTEIGLKVAGGFDIGVDIASGSLQMAAVTNEPTSPVAGSMKIYAKDIAGRMLLKTVGPSGLDTPYQPALFSNNVAMLLPNTGTGVSVLGMPNTAVGTISTPAITTTNLLNSMRRSTVTSATTANSAAELRSTAPLVWRGNAPGLGGFFYASRFSTSSTTANQRLFSGLTATTGATATTVAPSAILNMIGVGWDSADANLQIMSNDASGLGTKVDLGANFPANNTSAVYELILYAAASGDSVGYRVQRLDTNQFTSGTITTDLPASTSLLTHHQYMNNGGTGLAVKLNVNRVYIESDY
jgi:hypothetical protein